MKLLLMKKLLKKVISSASPSMEPLATVFSSMNAKMTRSVEKVSAVVTKVLRMRKRRMENLILITVKCL